MYAFVLIHFGDNIKVLENELYFLMNLQKCTKHDIIYMFSETDTPRSFIKAINNLNKGIKLIGIKDKETTFKAAENFKSSYERFNTIRTCNFMYAFKLKQYSKICTLESDMYIRENIDDIFDLQEPAVLNTWTIERKPTKEIKYTNNQITKNLPKNKFMIHGSVINGGVMLFKPDVKIFKKLKKYFFKMLKLKDYPKYPNEALFVYTMMRLKIKVFNMPIKYNCLHRKITEYFEKTKSKAIIYHFDFSEYKLLDVVKDGYVYKDEQRNIVTKEYKEKIYDVFKDKINKTLEKLN